MHSRMQNFASGRVYFPHGSTTGTAARDPYEVAAQGGYRLGNAPDPAVSADWARVSILGARHGQLANPARHHRHVDQPAANSRQQSNRCVRMVGHGYGSCVALPLESSAA